MEPKLSNPFLIAALIAALFACSPLQGEEDETGASAKQAKSKTKVKAKAPSESVEDPVLLDAVFPPPVARPSALQPGITLRDEEGREVKAVLISAHGENVKIQRVDDEREFTVPIATFDDYSKDTIRSWIDTDPTAVQYSLAISAQRVLIDSTDFSLSGRTMKSARWAYRVKIANQTRNDLSNAQVEFRIIYDDKIEFARSTPLPGKGPGQQEGQAADLPKMAFNDEVEFTTPSVSIDTYEFVPTRGPREQIRDSLKGIWVRVLRHGEVIAEYKSNTASMGNLVWDQEDEIEIKFTNRFRESTERRSD